MTPVIPDPGEDFKGAAKYYLNNKDGEGRDRVAWTHTENLPTQNPDRAWKMMAYTASLEGWLKEKSGHKRTKPVTHPVFTMSLSWHPEQKPDKAHMLETAKDAVAYLGLSEYQALYVSHNDEPQPHVHVILNRVHPLTGICARDGKSWERIQKWAHGYELKHGKIYCHERDKKQKQRENGQKVERYCDPVIKQAWLRSDNGKSFQAALAPHGYRLARGDRGILVVDKWGKHHSPARRLGIRIAVFRARVADLDETRLPEVEAVQREAKKQVKLEYKASRKFDFWAATFKNNMQTKHFEDQDRVNNKHERRIRDKRDELVAFYKIEDVKDEIARQKRIAADTGLLNILKRKQAEVELQHLQERLERSTDLIANEMSFLEGERLKEIAQLAKIHEEQKQRAIEMIERKKPEFYREETLKAQAPARNRTRQTGRERENGPEL
jgi:Relaxase/Mobilisation nuclease domain